MSVFSVDERVNSLESRVDKLETKVEKLSGEPVKARCAACKTLIWHTRQVNDIDSNPLDCYWSLGRINDSDVRLYTITQQFPTYDGYTLIPDSVPECFILHEAIGGIPASQVDSSSTREMFGDYCFKNRGTIIRVFRTLDEAKARAEVQLEHIKAIINSYFPEKQ